MKVGAIIQARMGSTRLPGKVMKNLSGKTVLSHVIERVKQSKEIDEIVIATSMSEQDEIISKEAKECNVKLFRGSEYNVLSRYYYAAKENNVDIIVRITSDCPLIDPIIIDNAINLYKENDHDIVTNAGSDLTKRTFPRGLDTEVFSFRILEEAFSNVEKDYQREHVTPYIYENSNKIYYYKNEVDYSNYRWTLDTKEDWKLISKVYDHLYNGEHDFYLNDIINLMKKYPELNEINKDIEQKKVN